MQKIMNRPTILFASFWILFILFASVKCTRETREEKPATNTPILLTHSQNITVREGDTAKLPCDVKDLKPLLAIWLKDPQVALYASTYRITTDQRITLNAPENTTQNELVIKGIVLADGGKYSCKIGSDPPLQVDHYLWVVAPPHVKTYPENGVLNIRKNEDINLTCIATGTPTPSVTWLKRDDDLPKGVDNEKETLFIPNATRDNAGIYECTASNIAHGQMTQTFRVQVNYQPEIEVENSVVYTAVGEEAYLVCNIYASPSAHTFWTRKSGDYIRPSDKYLQFQNSTIILMKIQNITTSDFGDYVCVANNSLGRAAASIEVVGRPAPTKLTSEILAYSDDTYLLSWEVYSLSPINKYVIRYKKDDEKETQWQTREYAPTNQSGPVYTERTIIGSLALGRYALQVQAENQHGWNRPNPQFSFTLVGPSKTTDNSSIQLSSIFINIILSASSILFALLMVL